MLRHCAQRLLQLYEGESSLTEEEVARDVRIDRGYLYAHARLRLNYTTYDVQRAQCTITVGTDKADVMLLPEESSDDDNLHPFRYARVLRIFHANVSHPLLSPLPTRLDFLWVRWFRCITPWDNSWKRCELDKVAFVPAHEEGAFGFLDPSQVLRNMHLCPSFNEGRTTEYLGPSIFRPREGDYIAHYVMQYVHLPSCIEILTLHRFSDRDLVFRYLGLGIGHRGVVPSILRRRQPPTKIDPEPDPEIPDPPADSPTSSAGEEAGRNNGEAAQPSSQIELEPAETEVVQPEEEEAIDAHMSDSEDEEGSGEDDNDEDEQEPDIDDIYSDSEDEQ